MACNPTDLEPPATRRRRSAAPDTTPDASPVVGTKPVWSGLRIPSLCTVFKHDNGKQRFGADDRHLTRETRPRARPPQDWQGCGATSTSGDTSPNPGELGRVVAGRAATRDGNRRS